MTFVKLKLPAALCHIHPPPLSGTTKRVCAEVALPKHEAGANESVTRDPRNVKPQPFNEQRGAATGLAPAAHPGWADLRCPGRFDGPGKFIFKSVKEPVQNHLNGFLMMSKVASAEPNLRIAQPVEDRRVERIHSDICAADAAVGHINPVVGETRAQTVGLRLEPPALSARPGETKRGAAHAMREWRRATRTGLHQQIADAGEIG